LDESEPDMSTKQPLRQPSRWVRSREICSKPGEPGLLPLSRTSLHSLIAKGKFPRGVVLSPGITAWREDVVLSWAAEREASGMRSARGGDRRKPEAAATDPK
jgi:predicted DNA-binding transcriptional regulator AlpA